MKKLMYKLSALTVAGVIMMGVGGCEKHGEPVPEYLAVCIIFVKTSPGEEAILLAKSENGYFSNEDMLTLLADFQSDYGVENISWFNTNLTRPELEAVPDCYEITMTCNIADPPQGWYPIMVEKIEGNIRIFKLYGWAFTENYIDSVISSIEDYYNKYSYDGNIISTTKKNLGPEVNNEFIIF